MTSRNSKISEDQFEDALEDYLKGNGSTKVAEKYGATDEAFLKRAREIGAVRPKDSRLLDQKDKIIKLRKEGLSFRAIAKAIGEKESANVGIKKMLNKLGIN